MSGQRATRAVTALAGRQYGLLARAQLLAAGVTDRTVDRLVAHGWLQRVHVGVFAVGAPRFDDPARWMAATLATRGILSHRSAAEVWELLTPQGGAVHVTTMTRAGRRRRGITVHAQPLRREEITHRRRVPCTSLVRTLIDLAASVDTRTLARAFEQAQVIHHLRPILLATVVLDRPGHRGTARLRPLLADAIDPGEIDSVLELRFLHLCRDWGLGRPATQAKFGPWRADFLFRERALVIETDGGRFHATAAARARDARKSAYLESIGLVVLRVSWFELRDRPAELYERIRDAPNGTFSPGTGENGPLAA